MLPYYDLELMSGYRQQQIEHFLVESGNRYPAPGLFARVLGALGAVLQAAVAKVRPTPAPAPAPSQCCHSCCTP